MSTIPGVQPGGFSPARYSSQGATLARRALDLVSQEKNPEKARSVQYESLQSIINDLSTTYDEKLLARLGKDFSTQDLSDSEVVRGRSLALGAIASTVPGSIGMVVARTAVEAAAALKTTGARAYLYSALDLISGGEPCAPEEKKVAQFGKSLPGNSLTDRDVVLTRKLAAASIAAGVSAPLTQAVVGIALEAIPGLSSSESSRSVLYSALDAILQDDRSGGFEKTLAAFGKSFTGNDMTDANVANLRAITIKTIQAGPPVSGRTSEALGRICLESLKSASSSDAGRSTLYQTLDTILKLDTLTPAERALASFGKALPGDSLTGSDVVKGRERALRALIDNPQDPPSHLIARCALDTTGEMGSSKARRSLLYTALFHLKESGALSDDQKKIVERGLQASGNDDNSVVKSRVKALEDFLACRTPEQRAKEELAAMAEHLNRDDAESVVDIDSEIVSIDGVKLQKRKEPPAQ